MRPTHSNFVNGPTTILLLTGAFLLLSLGSQLPSPQRVDRILMGQKLTHAQQDQLTKQRAQHYEAKNAVRQQIGATLLSGQYRGDYEARVDYERHTAHYTEHDKLTLLRGYLLQSPLGDEGASYSALSQMNPGEFDLDPHFYNYGGVFLYPLGGIIFLFTQLDLFKATNNFSYYLNNPREIEKLYIFGRSLNIIFFLGIILTVYRLTESLVSRRAASFAAAAFALSQMGWFMVLSARPHLSATFWIFLAALFLAHYARSGRAKHCSWSILCYGLGVGSLLPAAICGLMYPILLVGQIPIRRALIISALAAIGGVSIYVVTNPYAVINFPEWISNFLFHAVSDRYERASFDIPRLLYFLKEFSYALCFPVSVIAIGYALMASFTQVPNLVRRFSYLTIALVLLGGATLGTGRILYFLAPFVCLLSGIAIDELLKPRTRLPLRALRVALVCILFVPSVSSAGIFLFDSLTEDRLHESYYEWAANFGENPSPVGVIRDPIPYHVPPFPFLSSPMVSMLHLEKEADPLPRYVLVSSGQRPLWEKSWARRYYERKLTSGIEPLPLWVRYLGIEGQRYDRYHNQIDVFEIRQEHRSSS